MTDSSPNTTQEKAKSEQSDELSTNTKILDKIQHLPPEDKEHIIATMEMYSGPIPHPAILEGYQKLYPDAAKEIIQNGVDESRHRRELESKRQKRRGRLAWIAMIGGLMLCGLFIVASFWLIMLGHTIIGTVFASGGFLSIIGTVFDLVPRLVANDDLHSDEE
ncbi:DUF2335 domain-containing protein [Levilactobacillus angrenensis]|uniref:DUF2335 domain-containing protein n=1 Tax=Levilactobacillus angrenensis TaxID=2486020 RepID=A0ABW1U8B0_9LACO|nr:DUF2335 domain-containing protein [Levilactobacillus angrenensis]